MREMQEGRYNMYVRRVLPNGEVVELDPHDDWCMKTNSESEDWAIEYTKISCNRTIPFIREDEYEEARPKRRVHEISKDYKDLIAEFAATEGMNAKPSEEATMATLVADEEEAVAEDTSEKKGRGKKKRKKTSSAMIEVEGLAPPPSVDNNYMGEVITTMMPEKSTFLDAESFYQRVPQETRENNTKVLRKVREVNNLAKRIIIEEIKLRFEDQITVLDGCCGKGGDLKKWGGKVQELYGLDKSSALLKEMEKRWKNDLALCPKVIYPVQCDVSKPLENFKTRCDVVSCMFALNYMDERKGELTTCLKNICKSLKDTAVVVFIYANSVVTRRFVNTVECIITPITKGDWSARYNFRLGNLVDAIEFEVNPSVISKVMSDEGFVREKRMSMFGYCSSKVDWRDKDSGLPLTSAMLISNLYTIEMWIR